MKSSEVRQRDEQRLASEPRVVSLAVGQIRVLELIASGATLTETLDALLIFLERDIPEMLCSVLLLDPDGLHLRHGSAPSLPVPYCRAIDGAPVGPRSGSCGTAAHLRRQVVVADIEADPLWADYRPLARQHQLRACWSTPIFGRDDALLGTFAMYFRTPGSPTDVHRGLIGIATHVAAIAIEKDQREREVRDSQERYRLLNLATNDAVWDWDVKTNRIWWNDAVERLFGYPASEVSSEYAWWVERVHAEDRPRVHQSLRHAADSQATSWSEEYRFRKRDGSFAQIQDRGYVMRDADGATTRIIGTMQDISERKRAQEEMRRLAYEEPVTGLPNRTFMHAELARLLAPEAAEPAQALALVLLNLDCFRDINDSLGHHSGDLLLRELSARLRRELEPTARVGCLGGDEFALVVPQVAHAGEAERLVAAIRDCIQQPVEVAGISVRAEATAGVALAPRDGDSAELLWRRAHIALRAAKERREPYACYHPSIDQHDPLRLALVAELRTAIAGDELQLHYQPKLDLRTAKVIGVEALVRWQHPSRGLIFPDTFIPLAERTGLINPLTTWVLKAALQQGLKLDEAGAPLDLSVNISARNLYDSGFCSEILALVKTTGFPVSRLTLEVTETAIMADPLRAKAVLQQLHDAGLHISMDDFGIGQSSLTYLKDLPFTKMKIDKSFVMGFDQPRNVAIVRTAIDLARNMNLVVTAEGIEDELTYLALRELGCDQGQGYFFSKPIPAAGLLTWLSQSRWR